MDGWVGGWSYYPNLQFDSRRFDDWIGLVWLAGVLDRDSIRFVKQAGGNLYLFHLLHHITFIALPDLRVRFRISHCL